MLGVTRRAAHPQKAMVQPTTFEVILEFPLHVTRQGRALRRHVRNECRVVLFDDPIEKGLLGPVALVTANVGTGRGVPCRSAVRYDSRP